MDKLVLPRCQVKSAVFSYNRIYKHKPLNGVAGNKGFKIEYKGIKIVGDTYLKRETGKCYKVGSKLTEFLNLVRTSFVQCKYSCANH